MEKETGLEFWVEDPESGGIIRKKVFKLQRAEGMSVIGCWPKWAW